MDGESMSKSLWRVLGSWSLFSSAQWMFMVAAGVAAYNHSGAGAVGVVAVARLVPALFAAPVAGTLIDRLDRSRVVAGSCALTTVAFAAGAVVVSDDLRLGFLVAAIVAVSAFGMPPRPALESMLPALARTPGDLVRATAMWSAGDNAGFLVGAGAGGTLLALVGPGSVMACSAALAAATTVLVVGLPRTLAGEVEDDAAHAGVLAGIRVVASTPPLRAPFVLLAGLTMLEGSTDVQLVALAIDRLDLGNGGPGLLYLVWGAGGLAGSVVMLRIVRRTGYGRVLLVGALVFGVLVVAAGVGGVVVAVAAMFPIGLGFALVEGGVMGVIPRLADDAVIGRVYGVTELLYSGAAAVGAALAPVLILWWGVGASLVVVGLAYVALALATWRRCARLDQGQQTATRVRDLLHDVAFLEPLPLPQLERLVRSARPVAVAPGDDVVTLGETGQEFYVVDTGELDVVEFGRMLGPGDGFGEIALVRDVPRTATIRARTESHLWAVARAPFLAALRASPDARVAATGTVEQHLRRPSVAEGPEPVEPWKEAEDRRHRA
jgi:predicted MFS family arabinose efflux permease